MTGTREPRRGARIAASFWVGIEGVDRRPVVRQGNLSASGMYFEIATAAGPAGSVQFLHIESEDHRVVVQVLARIIRATEIDDVVTGKRVGLAVEFMPTSQDGRRNLERLVRHVVELGLRQEEAVEHGFDVEVVEHPTERTTLQRLSVQRLVLETDWQARVGDQLQFQINAARSPGGQVPLDGQVTGVSTLEEGYRVEIRITGIGQQRDDMIESEVQAFADIISRPVDDFVLPERGDLSGLLSRIKLPTLLGLLEMEALSGELSFTTADHDDVVLFLSEGQLVDGARAEQQAPVRELLSSLMKRAEAEFHFVVGPMERQNLVGRSMTSLILDLAREEDESTREPSASAIDSDDSWQ